MDTTPGFCDPQTVYNAVNHAPFTGSGDRVPARGVAWVLRWTAALAILYFSGCVLAEFAYCLAAERMLARAVRAGALEATLPRATTQSVAATAARRLASYNNVAGRCQLVILQNGAPLRAKLQPQPGDRLSVSIAVPVRTVMPNWLQTLKFWGSEQILITAERRMPGPDLSRDRES
jgi:hypothetical protein